MKPIKVINLGARGADSNEAPLPKRDGSLYRHPNPDGTAKLCGNCMMFISGHDRCSIHLPDQIIEESDWCGFHIFGDPMTESTPHANMQALTPDISGLREAGSGIGCGSCKFYQDQGNGRGLCYGLSDSESRKPPISVETRGICARYEGL